MRIYFLLIISFSLYSCSSPVNNEKKIKGEKQKNTENPLNKLMDTTILNLSIENRIDFYKRLVYHPNTREWLLHEYIYFEDSSKIDFNNSFFMYSLFNNDTILTNKNIYTEKFIGYFNDFDSCKIEIIHKSDTILETKTINHNILLKYNNLLSGFNYFIVNIKPFKHVIYDNKPDILYRIISFSKVIYKFSN